MKQSSINFNEENGNTNTLPGGNKICSGEAFRNRSESSGNQPSIPCSFSNVAMEILIASAHTENFNLGFAVQVALLHDMIEDTSATFGELKDVFGVEIANGVSVYIKK